MKTAKGVPKPLSPRQAQHHARHLLTHITGLESPSDQYVAVEAALKLLERVDTSKPRFISLSYEFRSRLEGFKPSSAQAIADLYDWTVKYLLAKMAGR